MKPGPNSGAPTLEAERSSRRGEEYRVPCLTAQPKEEVKPEKQVKSTDSVDSKELVELKEQIQLQEFGYSHQSAPDFDEEESHGLFQAWTSKLRGVWNKSPKQECLPLTGVEGDQKQLYPLTELDEGKAQKHQTPGVNEGKTQKHLASEVNKGNPLWRLYNKVSEVTPQQYIFTGGDEDGDQPGSLSSKLPTELWLQIMRHLTPGSLWTLRLSSPVFFNLFNKSEEFRHFHGTPGLKDRYVRFNLETMTKSEREEALEKLRRDDPAASNLAAKDPRSYCNACTEVLSRGEDHPMMIKLRETRFCDGCKERHLCVFFPPEDIDLHDRELLDELLCVGRLGTVKLCSHQLAKSLTWKKVEDERRHGHSSYRPLELECINDCHEPLRRDRRRIDGSSCPKLTAKYGYRKETIDMKLEWNRPLLDIDQQYPPSVKDIRRTLANLLDGVFAQHPPCRHMLDSRQLRTFAFTGICKCFGKRDHVAKRADMSPYLPKNTCSCLRRTYLECRECAATYCWVLRDCRISLSYCYDWTISQPTSPAWINLLDEGPQGLGMFTEDNKHLLWCDGSGCSTGMGRRWEEMLKEAVWLHDLLYNPNGKDFDRRQRWKSLEDVHNRSTIRRKQHKPFLGGFELAPHLLKTEYNEDTRQFLSRIKKAAEKAQEEEAQKRRERQRKLVK